MRDEVVAVKDRVAKSEGVGVVRMEKKSGFEFGIIDRDDGGIDFDEDVGSLFPKFDAVIIWTRGNRIQNGTVFGREAKDFSVTSRDDVWPLKNSGAEK